ncbi:hypothetical protein ACF0H5_014845 [Mactra antiquata]
MDAPCKVYVWNRLFSPGHIALELPNKIYISFWPRPKGKKSVFNASGTLYEKFSEETKVNGRPSRTLLVQDLNVQEIILWWAEFCCDENKWDLTALNCSDVVFHALCAGSHWFKDKTGTFLPNTPAKVAGLVDKYIKEQQQHQKDRKNSSESNCTIQ